MTRQEIIKEVNYRLSLLENSTINVSTELSFLRLFVSSNSVSDIESIGQIDECDMFLAYLLEESNVSYEILKEKIDLIRPLVNDPNMTRRNLRNVFSGIIANFNYSGSTDAAIKDTAVGKVKKALNNRKLTEVLKKNNISPECLPGANAFSALVLLVTSDIISGHDFDEEVENDIGEELKSRLDMFSDAFSLMSMIKGAKETCNGTNPSVALVDENNHVLTINDENITKKDKKYINKQVSKMKEYQDIKSAFNRILGYYRNHETHLNRVVKDRNKKAQQYRNFLLSLQSIPSNEEITNYHKTLEFIPDEDLKLQFLKCIYEHNLSYYQELEEEYKRVFTKEKSLYNKVLSEYSLPNNTEFLNDIIIKYTLDELREALESLKRINFTDKELVCQALSISSKETITFLSSLTEKQIIPVAFYKDNLSIFSNESPTRHTVLENINSITSSGINPRYLYEYTDILLVDNDSLQERIDLMNDEGLLNSIKKDSDISFFKTPDLAKRISVIKRTTHMPSVIEDIDLLNASSTRWKRVLVMDTIDMSVSKEELSAFLEKDDFFIPDSKLDEFIPSSTNAPKKLTLEI